MEGAVRENGICTAAVSLLWKWVSTDPFGVPPSRGPGVRAVPGPLSVRGGALYCTILVPLFGPGGESRRALAGGQPSRAFNLQLARLQASSSFHFPI